MTGLYSWFSRKHRAQSKVGIVDIIDIRKTARTFTFTAPFVFVHRYMLQLRFSSTSVDIFGFADGAALGNGIELQYNDQSILKLDGKDYKITTNADLELISHDSRTLPDTAGNTSRTVKTRFTIEKFSTEGYDMRKPNIFKIITNDDLSSVGTALFVAAEGWIWGRQPL